MHRRGCFFAALLLFLGALAFSPTDAHAQVKRGGNFGIGLGFSNVAYPISMKYFLESDLSLQGTVGVWNRGWWGRDCHYHGRDWSCHGRGHRGDILGIGADLLYEGQPLAGNGKVSLSWEIGGGLGIGIGDGNYDDRHYNDDLFFGLNLAGVLGLQLNIDALPIDVVLEYRPNLLFVPDVDFDVLAAGFHVRYYF